MLTPREFHDRYGQPVARTYVIASLDTLRIPQNRDRYLLIFWMCEDSNIVSPDVLEANTWGVANWTNTSTPIEITHALHGSLVSMPWKVETLSPFGVRVMIIEGFMREAPLKPRRGKRDAK